jgi:phosphopantothenoylcysteine decarboxylase/phosphopantothenate--cysteine ligase
MTRVSGKTIVLGITGGIAAYKAAELCRLLVKAGATVHVVMTKAAEQFITPLTMQTLSGHPVAHDLFDLAEESRIGHIRLADDADLIVIAPATADAIARVAAGMADDLLSAVVLASRAPVLLAPAMNVNMWSSPITQQNLGRLAALGRFRTVGPDVGELACGWVGPGRLIEPSEIAAATERLLTPQDLAGRRVVVTAGPTFEPLDDVRFLGNRSSGKMGFAIAEAAARRGAHVTLIAGPVALPTPPGAGIVRRDVETAEDLRAVLLPACAHADAVVMAAAVADFRPAARVAGKLSRRAGRGTAAGGAPTAATLPGPAADGDVPAALSLVANPDLLAELGRERRGGRPLLVGFAAESSRDAAALVTRAREKLTEKNCDVIVANDISAPGLGFGSDENALTLVFANGKTDTLARAPKTQLADALWDRLLARFPGDRARPRAATGRRAGGAAARSTSLRADRARGRRG